MVNNGITIRGVTGNRGDVILDAGGMGSGLTHAILIDADDVTVADLTIRNAGEHGVSWDGRDDRGVAAASGVYFCELGAGGEVLRRSMVLLQ